ncbi:hypothetical protein [Gimesia algae]|uniref:Uncharacterized protein n=1 Tax=Gimesia algae TaxID=2527971 RepID=A0A517VKK1_9PLAN|nr:hypothetical protein [Gimesia algae]QDT93546.1 hypothetical protein Pan161_52260 [Gimesia algae]
MWCTSCQSDVAAEVSSDSKRVQCATCGSDLGTTAAARISDKTKEARELLARWSNREILDPYGPLTRSESRAQSTASLFEQPEPQRAEPYSQPAKKSVPEPAPSLQTGDSNLDPDITIEQTYAYEEHEPEHVDDFEEAIVPRLHSEYRDIQDLIEEDDQKPNWLGLVGQLMAYGGVAVLTIGTTLVLWGYYGGPANYASTGWLISTAGQMLLFLGVITLVSAGMEQTTSSVSRRIDRLGKRIFMFEQAMLEQQQSQTRRRRTSSTATHTAPEPATRKSA